MTAYCLVHDWILLNLYRETGQVAYFFQKFNWLKKVLLIKGTKFAAILRFFHTSKQSEIPANNDILL